MVDRRLWYAKASHVSKVILLPIPTAQEVSHGTPTLHAGPFTVCRAADLRVFLSTGTVVYH